MASSPSSVSYLQYCAQWKYDVFLSFRGADTRKTFTGHLHEGLKNRGIYTFQDDKRLEEGNSISEELLKAIEESQVALIIFSKNYATSSWCLNEVVKIMECKEKNGQTVIPIFYDVDPSHVRYQSKGFAEAFAKHELRFKDDAEGMQNMQAWRTALTAAANLKGYDIRDGIESDCIQHVVDQVLSKLCKASISYLRNVVGIDTHLEKVNSLLEMEVNDVRLVGIWGMGGVGKTTIARAIFDTNTNQFDGACFLADIKESKCGMHSLQNILLSELLRKKDDYVNNKEDGKHMIARRLRFKKVLVVLDDIDHSDHLDNLAGDLDWFGQGSRIIVTTRDKHLIGKNDVVYEVTPLLDHDAIKLFHQYAFKEEVPGECFEKLSLEVINYAKGLPLALKVWGSFLHKRDITEWRSAIEQMKISSKSEIVEKLKISYNGLEIIQQDIFLDIACFLRGLTKAYIMPILESCYSGANIGLSVLIDKSLVFISKYDTIQMHDLIQNMGKYIVNMQKNPGERSRLWDIEDIEEVMVSNTGTMAVEAIWIPHHYYKKLWFSKEAMKNMQRLRILCIQEFSSQSENDGSIDYLPNNLRCFVWPRYCWKLLPQNFNPTRLVHLELRGSSLHHFWNETKQLPSLRRLHLSRSKNLKRTPDFKGMPNLEYLDLSGCRSLEEVHHSLRCSRKLIELNLNYCGSLETFPYVNVESLESLKLYYCSSLETFPEILGIMKPELEIKMSFSGIREIPSSIIQQCACRLTKLNMHNLVSLPSSICKLKGLVKLDVSKCSKLESLPEGIGDLEKLEYLDVSYTLISRPPSSIVRLNKLKRLNLRYCKLIDGLPEDIGSLSSLEELDLSGNNFEYLPRSIAQLGSLRSLDLSHCDKLKELPGFMGMPNLDTLKLSYCKLIDGGLPEDIGSLSSLQVLNLSENNFEHLPRSIAQLGALRSLDLSHCDKLKELPCFTGMSKLDTLKLSCCKLIDGGLPEDIGSLSSLQVLNLSESNFEHLPRRIAQLGALRSLDLSHCDKLKELPCFTGMSKLDALKLSYCKLIDGGLPEDIGSLSSLQVLNLSGNNFEHLPRSIAQLGALRSLDLSHCDKLKELPCFTGMSKLDTLKLSYCKLIDGGLPEDIGSLSSLQVLNLSGNNFEHLPRSIAQLGALRSLDLSHCDKLKELPCFTGMSKLDTLKLSYCNLVDGGLPEDIGSLSSLEELDLNGNNFEHLPRSIAQLGALWILRVSDCKRLAQLPEFPQQLDTIYADWSHDSICNLLFQNISSSQHDISASDSLSLRVFTNWQCMNIPSWFHHQGMGASVSVNLPENWYVSDNFLGFAVCCSGKLIDMTAHLIPLCDDGTSSMTHKFALSNHSKYGLHFFLVPLAGLWDASNANGKTPNNYRHFRLFSTGEKKKFGVRLLYKDEAELYIGIRRSRYEEASCSSFPQG